MLARFGVVVVVLLLVGAAVSAQAASSSSQVVIIGIDGLDPDLLQAKLKKGELPNFARFVDGAYFTRYDSEAPLRSPAIWTTVATGQHRSQHGIWDFVTGSKLWPEELRDKHKYRLMTSNDRKVRALWDYADAAGLSSTVINWMVTWPAEKVRGHIVAPYASLSKRKLATYKGQIRKDAPRQTHPPEFSAEVAPMVVAPEAISEGELAALGDFPPLRDKLYRKAPRLKEFRYGAQWTLASTETSTRIATHVMRRYQPALVLVYYDGPDTLGHRFWVFRREVKIIEERLRTIGADTSTAKELQRRFAKVVDGYYRVVDAVLGRLMDAAAKDATFIVLSDHGFGDLRGKPWKDMEIPYSGSHEKQGLMILRGPKVATLKAGTTLTLYDVAPTAMGVLGIPTPKALKGKALLGAATNQPSIADRRQNSGDSADVEAPDFESEELERLRSLGYVE